jgi:hypothetical protein
VSLVFDFGVVVVVLLLWAKSFVVFCMCTIVGILAYIRTVV